MRARGNVFDREYCNYQQQLQCVNTRVCMSIIALCVFNNINVNHYLHPVVSLYFTPRRIIRFGDSEGMGILARFSRFTSVFWRVRAKGLQSVNGRFFFLPPARTTSTRAACIIL